MHNKETTIISDKIKCDIVYHNIRVNFRPLSELLNAFPSFTKKMYSMENKRIT